MSLTLLSFQKWAIKCAGMLIFAINFFIFLLFDLFETILCVIYRFLDELFEGESSSCYCHNREKWGRNVGDGEDSKVSETLYGRKNVFRQMGFLGIPRKLEDFKKIGGGGMGMRWSDCGCEACVDWMKDGGQRLHVVVRQPSRATEEDCSGKPTENVIFLHGFLSSSLFWTETVFPNLSETSKCNYRLFAVDVLGFGRSPKPRDCLYTISDHLDMIENSVIDPFELTSFHLVAHSMGCVIALALAAKYSNIVKSITLVAPPYFPCSREEASSIALERLAGKALWPPLLFGSSFMTRDLHFIVVDLTRHTHHSAWHNMHNVICGGAKFMDNYLETLANSKVKIWVVQGTRDQVVPIECSNNIKMKVPDSEVDHIANADHGTVIFGREKDFTDKLEHLWQRAVAA
ncbi:probable lysophospholipase BODYGUARD 4 isoform X2 [Tripterygium wilfordii]|uniref:probable lysophospholipase BODYGUARD 4 isoform X2 n=1 Tax=Tripterygium wilfordii TaxID=458696 RepID=UPI0018F82B2C|nr:probable lysophospholipase BODYGUARD 4 isoform X2 [Tripterygium wilfordii]